MFLHLVLFLSILWLKLVHCRHNVTIDDLDPSIVYNPRASWVLSSQSSLNVGGAHMLTQDMSATATFTFTGVAIYFMSPLWPYTVNTAVSLDSGPPILLDLVDHSIPNVGEGPETVQSHVIWGAAGLPNTQHRLVISVGAGQPFAIVDSLIYTALDPEDLTTSSSPSSPTPGPSSTSSSQSSATSTSSTTTSDAATTTSSTTPEDSSSHVLPIVLGTIFGALAVLIIAAGIWFCKRRRRRPTSEAWTVAGIPYTGSHTAPPMSMAPDGGGLNGGNDYAYTGLHQPYDNNWRSQDYGTATIGPIPGAMAPATAAALAHPYASATPVSDGDKEGGGDAWQGTTAQIAARYMRSPNRYQPNTLSTITETSTPPLGGGTPLAHSPSSYPGDLGNDTSAHGDSASTERGPSLLMSENRGPPFSVLGADKRVPPHPPAYQR
ncbi:hypothetical protein D9615_010177 [Tricholomella constricta]|uniref:Uncharacterized protein n=1 Tax=Tricholomella constricta TaxID=117010 RepID=A0A8H5GR52_9AGAR|nr:hypothetical protein D9615_010177 [Tricholomella constricta]